MAEQYYPAVANELVEIDFAIRGVCLKVGSNATQTEPDLKRVSKRRSAAQAEYVGDWWGIRLRCGAFLRM